VLGTSPEKLAFSLSDSAISIIYNSLAIS